ncbi:MAG: class I SAM-dependent methyltransferase [Alphaproteobacteria bacterium]|nr:class I SAM-dependent methyltransferase [Alphaproteobacteria bacterium]
MQDALFDTVARWHGDRPWGRVLDAGTGRHSLRWILGLPTDGWTAVTGAESRATALTDEHRDHMRPGDRFAVGNWQDPGFLAGERYDVVLADYLLGAIDGFAPYFQDRLFARLRPHVGGRLYAVGLAPYDEPTDAVGEIVWEIARLRDACILLAGHRCYREYPRDWVERRLAGCGMTVVHAESVPIVYRERWIDGQLDVCLRKLPRFGDHGLAAAMRGRVEELRARAKATCALHDGLRFGHDWIVAAE